MSRRDAADAELLRLLAAYASACYRYATNHFTEREMDAARAALLDYHAAHYVRRDDPHFRILERGSEALVPFPIAGGGE